MFGLSFQELLLILALALIIFGPKKIPEVARALGKSLGSLKRAADDIKDDIDFQVNLDEEKRAIDETYRELNRKSDSAEKIDEDIK